MKFPMICLLLFVIMSPCIFFKSCTAKITPCSNQDWAINSWTTWSSSVSECGDGWKTRTRWVEKISECSGDSPFESVQRKTSFVKLCPDSSNDYTQYGCIKDKEIAQSSPVMLGNYRHFIALGKVKQAIDKCSIATINYGYRFFALKLNGDCFTGEHLETETSGEAGSGTSDTEDGSTPPDECWEEDGNSNAIVFKFLDDNVGF